MTATTTPKINNEERARRLDALRERMAKQAVDAVVLTPGTNLRYISGLAWGASERLVCAIIRHDRLLFVAPRFEASSLNASVPMPFDDAVYWDEHEDPHGLVARLLTDLGVTSCGLDPNCAYGHADALFAAANGVAWSSAYPQIAPLRACKSAAELALMRAAKQLTLEVHRTIFEQLAPGARPSEVRAEIDRLHRAGGADSGSSFCAVQFGAATSHPHGIPGDPPLQPGELVLIDTGCTLDGYNSDITRTYALDKVDERIERVWDLEKKAQAAAFATAGPGVPCETLDAVARNVLTEHGLGPDYTLPGLPHRLGHGIGLDVHEGPYLVRGDRTPLAPGMCFSNEPMIVFPDAFGVRLEDHFYITDTGAAWFTEPQHSLYQPFP
ncbi:MAG: Xaa-Pro peptidase family protein [Pseudomonadota bacterium]